MEGVVALLVIVGSVGLIVWDVRRNVPPKRMNDSGLMKQTILAWAANPFYCQTEGMRRTTIALSCVAVVGWFIWVAFEFRDVSQIRGDDWFIALGVPIAAYAVVLAIRLGVVWVLAGFKVDKSKKGGSL